MDDLRVLWRESSISFSGRESSGSHERRERRQVWEMKKCFWRNARERVYVSIRCLRLIYPNSRRCRASANLVRAACFIYRPTRANAVFSHSYAHAKWMYERGWLTGWDRRERAFYRSAHKRIQPAQRLDCSNHFYTFSPAFCTAIKIYHHRLWLLQSMNITMHYIPLHLPFMLVKVYEPAWMSAEKAKIKTAKQKIIAKKWQGECN